MSFAENLQRLRKGKSMSQERLAESIGVSRQAVSKWESGQSYPETDKLVMISELFHVTLDSLVKGGRDEDYVSPQDNRIVHDYFRPHYEYKSKKMIFNIPLVHINIGRGVYVARGILAIGNIAIGLLSFGIIALGVLAIGAVAVGLICFGGLSFGLLAAAGGIAVGTIAAGGIAAGIISMGGLSVGVFSFGGCAVASDIAVGGFASGHIAIGNTVKGAHTIVVQNHNFNSVKADQVRSLINQEYPHLWKPIVHFVTAFFN